MHNPDNQVSSEQESAVSSIQFELTPADNQRLVNLCGPVNKHMHQLEDFYDVKINCRSNLFEITGDGRRLKTVKNAILTLYNVAGHEVLTPATVQLYLNDNVDDDFEKVNAVDEEDNSDPLAERRKRHGKISGRGKSQQQYLQQIQNNDLTIGVGPAGTGKTYLAVACAVAALESEQVRRLCLVRPAVEAGERLGFLPGDMAQKVDPYLRPMYDEPELVDAVLGHLVDYYATVSERMWRNLCERLEIQDLPDQTKFQTNAEI